MKVNVDLVHGSWIKAPNGASTVLRTFYDNKSYLSEKGININFYTMEIFSDKFNDGIDQEEKTLKIRIKKILTYFRNLNNSFFIALNLYITYFRHAKKISKYYVNDNNNDNIVFLHDIFTCYYFLKYNKNKNKKIILILHNNGDTFNMLKNYYSDLENKIIYKYLLYIEKIVLKRISNIGFVAKKPLDDFKEKSNISSKNLFYIYNGVADLGYRLKEFNKYNLVCVGSLSHRKNQMIILESLLNVKEEIYKKIYITFVGDGVIRNELESFIKSKNLESKVTFIGFTNNVLKYLLDNNIFILPSKDEGFPMSILEGMSIGMPIISTNIAGIPEMIDDKKTGFLIEPNEESLTNTLNQLDNYDLELMGRKSYDKFNSQFSQLKMLNEYIKVFKNI